jgi:quercetin dioxygenase-like cupin family protein
MQVLLSEIVSEEGIPLHYHKEHDEIIQIIEGEGEGEGIIGDTENPDRMFL